MLHATTMAKKTTFATVTPTGRMLAMDFIIEDIPSDDPFSYAYGFRHGFHGLPMDQSDDPNDPLAPEYIKGYDHGVRVARMLDPMPPWASQTQEKN